MNAHDTHASTAASAQDAAMQAYTRFCIRTDREPLPVTLANAAAYLAWAASRACAERDGASC